MLRILKVVSIMETLAVCGDGGIWRGEEEEEEEEEEEVMVVS